MKRFESGVERGYGICIVRGFREQVRPTPVSKSYSQYCLEAKRLDNLSVPSSFVFCDFWFRPEALEKNPAIPELFPMSFKWFILGEGEERKRWMK